MELPLTQKIKSDQKQRSLLSLYITAGFPELEATSELLRLLDQNGADLIELGVPFSDPLADGPTIQRSCQRALENGVTMHKVLDMARAAAPVVRAPVILMGYFNPIFKFGLKAFVASAAQSGVQGLIIPDLPPEESLPLREIALSAGISLVYMISPNTSTERIRLIDELTTSFIYAVSVTGVTGARANLAAQAGDFLSRLRAQSRHPVLVGFGVASGKDAAQLAQHCAGVIAGSALLHVIEKWWGRPGGHEKIAAFVRELREALNA
ncbi:MAG: tryptophan synthase subunit alpha [bacterium]